MKQQERELLSDEQIIDLYFAREERAITETDNKYRGYLHTVANNILANEQDAEECLQDTYLRTWNTIPPERPSVFHAFLAKITRNLSLNRYPLKQSALWTRCRIFCPTRTDLTTIRCPRVSDALL